MKIPDFSEENDFMVKINLNQAYCLIPTKPSHRRFLSITRRGTAYQVTCLPVPGSTYGCLQQKVGLWASLALSLSPCLIPRHLNSAKRTYLLVAPRWVKVYWRVDLKRRALAPPFQIWNLHLHLVDAVTQTPLPEAQKLCLKVWTIWGDLNMWGIGQRKKETWTRHTKNL